ncbi:MAG: hypothetical protein Q8K78_14065 [Planctomycetaceae bacterium]|nr:hypothetical protein [Planctomycetaceae bacterium]
MSQGILSVREPLAQYAAEQAQARGFTDATAFVEHLIEADRRDSMRARVEQALAEGLASPAIDMPSDWSAQKRALIASITPESAP